MLYRISREALEDIDTLLYSIAEHSGWERSMRAEEELFAEFDRIAASPGIGHLRQDLLTEPIYFWYSEPYLILYRRDLPLPTVLAVVHGARDIASLMADRL